ncbi:MAG: hypothetical protein ABS35_13550 [Kaistia sp. SCN 65-12]|nr:MAG: hypothetical protein ABS35_13550 [Kaistia sp. SCN 65-12]
MKFYGQFDYQVDRFIFERYFPDKNIKGTFVECGAFDGLTECSCKFFEDTMEWSAYNLEPVPWIFDKLQINRPNSNNFNVGLSNKSGETTFQSVIHPTFGRDTTIGAIEHSDSIRANLMDAGCTFEPVTVTTITWADFIKLSGLSRIDLMVLDVEGHELAVLEGMIGSQVLPDVMCVEFGHIGFNLLRAMVEEMGYLYDIHSNANAFFIKKEALPLFALRRFAHDQRQTSQSAPELEMLRRQVEHLSARETELVELYQTVTSSKIWKISEYLRKLFRR